MENLKTQKYTGIGQSSFCHFFAGEHACNLNNPFIRLQLPDPGVGCVLRIFFINNKLLPWMPAGAGG